MTLLSGVKYYNILLEYTEDESKPLLWNASNNPLDCTMWKLRIPITKTWSHFRLLSLIYDSTTQKDYSD